MSQRYPYVPLFPLSCVESHIFFCFTRCLVALFFVLSSWRCRWRWWECQVDRARCFSTDSPFFLHANYPCLNQILHTSHLTLARSNTPGGQARQVAKTGISRLANKQKRVSLHDCAAARRPGGPRARNGAAGNSEAALVFTETAPALWLTPPLAIGGLCFHATLGGAVAQVRIGKNEKVAWIANATGPLSLFPSEPPSSTPTSHLIPTSDPKRNHARQGRLRSFRRHRGESNASSSFPPRSAIAQLDARSLTPPTHSRNRHWCSEGEQRCGFR